ncbi:MAG: NrtA/SsuA/CpmA family ABC transporter substrate-binding protein [Candidatus Rokubacteria bacterium]|nr:transporter substrate-binding domain-containing protein [Alphaproteobacteria bacterium]MBM4443322.1 NrtA/SsuA/CpmA family ABC transporter substrate-binding protein [Candidatus Rokubacteria bacterium]
MKSATGNPGRRLGAATLALAAAVLLTAGAAQAQALRKISVGMQPIVNGPIYIAIHEKYFEKLGLEVNLVKFTSGPAQFAALAGGQIDLAWGGMGAFSLAKANGQDLHFISIFMDYNPLQALLVPANSPVKSIKDLVGRKVALVQGSDAHYGTLRTLAKYGVDPKSVNIVGMAPPQQIAAMEKGDVDAMYIWEPFITPVLEKGGRCRA